MADKPITYSSYLRVPELLRLQKPLTRAHDELLFIAVHQAYEIWFKLVLFEIESARAALQAGTPAPAARFLRRVHAVLRALIASFDVIETMRPYDFLEFRARLEPASGFQSVQFRELEFLSGLKDRRYLGVLERPFRGILERRLREPSLWDAYLGLLKRRRLPVGTDGALIRSIVRILERPDRHPLWEITEALLSYDQLFLSWRTRHLQMSMRMIGEKPGTGRRGAETLVGAGYDRMGQAGGVNYLRTTLAKVLFPPLWEAQTRIQRR